MTFRRLFPLAIAFSAMACEPASETPEIPENPTTTNELGNATQTICADGTSSLCSTLPTDMAGHEPAIGYIPNTNAGAATGSFNQTFIDYFGWQSFVALNWPTDENGNPSTTETIVTDTTSPRVWSTYATAEDIFGTAVAGVEDAPCDTDGKRVLFRTSKFELTSFIEAFTPDPLIDRNGNFTLYDVRVNEREVTYLDSNHLTTKSGQSNFGKAYDFPAGSGSDVGSIEIKSSWRIMTSSDDADSFYTTAATIIVPAEYSQSGDAMCIDTTVGLVGMHIMQKFTNPTDFSNFWAWATFEHVDNAPLADDAVVSPTNDASTLTTLTPPPCDLTPDTNDQTVYSFYNAACTDGTSDCAVNTAPSAPDNVFKWSASEPYASAYLIDGKYGTQVARCFKIYESANTVTSAYQAEFGSSLWKNYMLVGVQWAEVSSTGTGPFKDLTPFAAPIYLANTTMETYLQTGSLTDPVDGSGSCITCHNLAVDTAKNNSNFSFLPGTATEP